MTNVSDQAWEQVVELDRRNAERTLERLAAYIPRYGAANAVRNLGKEVTFADVTLRFVRYVAESMNEHRATVCEAIGHALGMLDCSPARSLARFLGTNHTDPFDRAVQRAEAEARQHIWERYRTAVEDR